MADASPTTESDATVGEVHLAYKTILFFAALTLGMLLWITLNQPFGMMMGFAENATTSQTAATGQTRIQQIWRALPLIIVLLGVFGLLVAAVRESEIR
jgi:hypothetical protein